MKIAIGADHRGYRHKEYLKKELQQSHPDIEWVDVGAYDEKRSDYPIFAQEVCRAMRHGDAQLGILICGSGIGMAVAANRYPHIYAGLVWNADIARMSREDDNTNIIVIPSDFVSPDQAVALVISWLSSSFKGGRYQKRIDMIDAIEPQ